MKSFLAIAFLFTYTFACSQSKNVFVKLGTTGIGAGYEQKINTKWSATASLTHMNISPSIFVKGGSFQHRLKGIAKFTQIELATKWYPRAKATSYGSTNNNRFFIKTGILIRDNGKYLLQSDYQRTKPGKKFDNTDPALGKLIFNLQTNFIQPFLSTGFELLNTEKKWMATIEGGLSYHGTSPTIPFVNYYESGTIREYQQNFYTWVRVPKLIRLAKVYPLLNFTIGRRF